MTDGEEDGDPTPAPPSDPQALARDWITLWQSELAALASDREAQETWQRMVSLWAGAATAMTAFLPNGRRDETAGRAGPAAPQGAPPAAAAPGAGDDELERLRRHVAELERRLAELERRR